MSLSSRRPFLHQFFLYGFLLLAMMLAGVAGLTAPARKSAAGFIAPDKSKAREVPPATVPIVASNSVLDATEPEAAKKTRLQERYGKLPLSFEGNQGQTDRRVNFISRGSGYSLFLTPTEAVLRLRIADRRSRNELKKGLAAGSRTPSNPKSSVLRMKFVGANPSPQVLGVDELPGKSNYFIGNDPAKWQANVPNYARVKYEGVYPGVDLVYYGNQRQLEYDFVVAPGADPTAIKLALEGVRKMRVDARGDLVLRTTAGDVRWQQPIIYQEIDGVRRDVSAAYELKARRQVGFRVGAYDQSRPLIIDPVLVYSTYLGGNRIDEGLGIAVDAAGSAYVTGYTNSMNFPTTPGAFHTTPTDTFDAFVVKLDATGSSLAYSTYLGGSVDFFHNFDVGFSIAVDGAGSAYVAGRTDSPDFPTTLGAFQTTSAGGFVTKLNATGSALVYSTYLGGGSMNEYPQSIALDGSGSAYVAGLTDSPGFPTTFGAFQTTFAGASDAFVTKLDATGSTLIYSTYLGGSNFDIAYAIDVDISGGAYVTGFTNSTDFPTTFGAYQTTNADGFGVFVAKVSVTGSALAYSTYLGGNSFDIGYGITVDGSGSAYVTGATFSTDFPTTLGAFQTINGGTPDAFITKLNPTGSVLVYSTYLGGSSDERSYSIAVDAADNAYVTGFTYSTDFPVTSGTIQTTLKGFSDAFVTKLNPTGSALAYSTYLGGTGDLEFGYGIAVDSAGSAYVTGRTISTDFPTTSGAIQTTYGGGDDEGFVTKIGEGQSQDTDGDGVPDASDNCPYTPNPDQADADHDGVGDACDACPADPLNDADGDGVCGNVDNCPTTFNPYQADADHDGRGDACDACPRDPLNDADGDGVCGNVDNCPTTFNPDQADADHDRIGDVCEGGADLGIVKFANHKAQTGNKLYYVLAVKNYGPNSAPNTVITDALPGGTTLISAIPSQGACGSALNVVTCNMGNLVNGKIVAVLIVVKVTAAPGATLTNTATVKSSHPDPNLSNNTATASTLVVRKGDDDRDPRDDACVRRH